MPQKVPEPKKKAESAAEPLKIQVVAAPKVAKAKESGATIRNCSYTSSFQDSRYGCGRRAFTCSKKNGSSCTVFGKKS